MGSNAKRSPGAILFVMLVSMTAGAMCLNKVSPVLTDIMSAFSIQSASAGLLISVFVFSGIILAIPVGMIISKFGAYKMGILALAVTIIGSALGALTNSYAIMLISRIVEGIGLVFLMTIGPAAVGSAFSDKRRGAAMGLLMCFMAFGQIIMLNLAPLIASALSWKSIWWGTAIYAAIALILWIFIARGIDNSEKSEGAAISTTSILKETLTNKSLWLISITLMCYLITQQGTYSFLPTYLSTKLGYSTSAAGSIVSVASIVGIPVGILTGVVADKIGSRKKPLGVLMIGCAVSYLLMPWFPGAIYIVLIILYGIVTMGIVGLVMASATEVIDRPDQANMAISLVNMAQWIGIFLSSTIFGLLIDSFGWNIAFYAMIPIAILGSICAFLNKRLK